MGSLNIENVKKAFGPVEVLKGINLDVSDGEFVVFVGPSGCGKSTLLRVIAGLEDSTSGRVVIDGQDVSTTPPAKRGIAMVFQSYALYPHLTVRSNMGLGLKQIGTPAAEIDKRIEAASAMLSLKPYLERRPAELSGGQRQRVAIARALVRDSAVVVLDEPTTGLDAAARDRVLEALDALLADRTAIVISHDPAVLARADRVVDVRAVPAAPRSAAPPDPGADRVVDVTPAGPAGAVADGSAPRAAIA